MPPTDTKKKQSLYFPEEMLREIEAEAARQDRSLSWIVQRAWKAARKAIMEIPSMTPAGDHDGPRPSGPTPTSGPRGEG